MADRKFIRNKSKSLGGTLKYIFFIAISLSFAQHDDLFITPKNWPKPVYNFTNNALTKSKVELGRVLFYDPILSKDNTISNFLFSGIF